MREIKFRFWMGNYGECAYEYSDNLIRIGLEKGIPVLSQYLERPYNPKVVIEQFTGLYDENGKEIYEGDILTYQTKSNFIEVVEFYKGAFFLGGSLLKDKLKDKWGLVIVGNIHENKDLLKE